MSESVSVKPGDLLRRLHRLASRRRWEIEVTEGGRHTKVRMNGSFAPVPRHTSDLPAGTLRAILKQLGITAADLED